MNRLTDYTILPEINLILTVYSGEIIIQDFVNLTRRFIKDEQYKSEFHVLVDISQTNGIAFRLDVLDYVDFIRKNVSLKQKVKVGILIRGLNQEFLMKFYRTFGGLINMEINYFKEKEDYYRWMGWNEEEITQVDIALTQLRSEGLHSN